MYSHLSIQRGTVSIETTSHIDQITDPKMLVDIHTPKGIAYSGNVPSFLASHQKESQKNTALKTQDVPMSVQENLVFMTMNSSQKQEGQMKVVTKIRSKNKIGESVNTNDLVQKSTGSNQDPNGARVTMDFNEQVDIKALSVDGLSAGYHNQPDADLVELHQRRTSGQVEPVALATANSVVHPLNSSQADNS